MGRLTYKSSFGDYGSAIDYGDTYEDRMREVYALRNKLGKYEDNEWRDISKVGNPKESGLYIVTVYKCDEETENFCKNVKMIYYRSTKNQWNIPKFLGKVTAWKLPPKPYMEGEDEQF